MITLILNSKNLTLKIPVDTILLWKEKTMTNKLEKPQQITFDLTDRCQMQCVTCSKWKTVPSDVMLAFSTESTIIVDPGTIDLQIATKIEDGSFFIEHDDLYALWEIDTKSSAFVVYLYLDGPLTGETTGNKLHWTVAGGHSIIGGGEGKYCDSPESLSSSNSIEIAEKQKKNYVQLTIDFDIDGLIKAGSIEDDTYTGSIYMYYKEG